MKKRLLNFGRQYTISTWVITFFIVVIFPINVFLILVTTQYMDSLEDLSVGSGNSIMTVYAGNLNNEMSILRNYLFYLEEKEEDFIMASTMDTPGMGRLAYYRVFNMMRDNLMINSSFGLYFIGRNGERMLASGVSTNELTGYQEDMLAFTMEGQKLENNGKWNIQMVNGHMYLTLEKTEGLLYYGAVIPVEPFLDQIADHLNIPYKQLTITDRPGQVSAGEIIISEKLEHSSLYLELTLEEREITGQLPVLRKIEYMIAFLSILVIPLLYWLFHKILIHPMKNLEHSLTHMEEFSDFTDYRISNEFYTKELSHVKVAINGFVDQIQELRIDSYEKELEKQRIQMENMMLQVHPHFILNLFHLIYSMAQIRNYDGIQKASMYLSNYFRKLFGATDLHPVSEELELVKGYEGILQMRYPGCFAIKYDVDEETMQLQIPVLMIHAFLENIAKYAIRIGAYTDVRIICRQSGDDLKIVVSDDGCGIPEDILQEIENGQAVQKTDGRHIGLSNLKGRLNLLYGKRAQMKVSSKENEGTVVTITLPL